MRPDSHCIAVIFFVPQVGLGGELRPVGHIERRIGEALKVSKAGVACCFVMELTLSVSPSQLLLSITNPTHPRPPHTPHAAAGLPHFRGAGCRQCARLWPAQGRPHHRVPDGGGGLPGGAGQRQVAHQKSAAAAGQQAETIFRAAGPQSHSMLRVGTGISARHFIPPVFLLCNSRSCNTALRSSSAGSTVLIGGNHGLNSWGVALCKEAPSRSWTASEEGRLRLLTASGNAFRRGMGRLGEAEMGKR